MSEHRSHVKWFNNAKGYGFLVRAEGEDEVSSHVGFVQPRSLQPRNFRILKESDTHLADSRSSDAEPQTDRVSLAKKRSNTH